MAFQIASDPLIHIEMPLHIVVLQPLREYLYIAAAESCSRSTASQGRPPLMSISVKEVPWRDSVTRTVCMDDVQ